MAIKMMWMEVTDDEFELPLTVADSSYELARKLNLKQTTIANMSKRTNKGKAYTGRKIISINFDDYEEESEEK